MQKLISSDQVLIDYFNDAINDTIVNGDYDSKCLCHGSAGNLGILKKISKLKPINSLNKKLNDFNKKLTEDGFSSFGASQSIGLNLMTGITGAGYYFLDQSSKDNVLDFLTLD